MQKTTTRICGVDLWCVLLHKNKAAATGRRCGRLKTCDLHNWRSDGDGDSVGVGVCAALVERGADVCCSSRGVRLETASRASTADLNLDLVSHETFIFDGPRPRPAHLFAFRLLRASVLAAIYDFHRNSFTVSTTYRPPRPLIIVSNLNSQILIESIDCVCRYSALT